MCGEQSALAGWLLLAMRSTDTHAHVSLNLRKFHEPPPFDKELRNTHTLRCTRDAYTGYTADANAVLKAFIRQRGIHEDNAHSADQLWCVDCVCLREAAHWQLGKQILGTCEELFRSAEDAQNGPRYTMMGNSKVICRRRISEPSVFG